MPLEYVTIGLLLAALGFLWNLHRDMRAVSDRVSKLEGTVEILIKFLVEREERGAAR